MKYIITILVLFFSSLSVHAEGKCLDTLTKKDWRGIFLGVKTDSYIFVESIRALNNLGVDIKQLSAKKKYMFEGIKELDKITQALYHDGGCKGACDKPGALETLNINAEILCKTGNVPKG